MADPNHSSPSDLALAVAAAWNRLLPFLDGLTEEQARMADDQGWTARDHVAHIAVWENSVAILFRGRPRHEALGISPSFYAEAPFDQINEVIQARLASLSFDEAKALLAGVHSGLMADVARLNQAQLNTTVAALFPPAPPSDDRRVIDFVLENTAEHYREHQGWMEALLARRS